MSGDFFEQLNIPEPDTNLSAEEVRQAEQTGAIMISFEEYLMKNPTDLVLVVGDVTSTMACAITAQKLHIKVAPTKRVFAPMIGPCQKKLIDWLLMQSQTISSLPPMSLMQTLRHQDMEMIRSS